MFIDLGFILFVYLYSSIFNFCYIVVMMIIFLDIYFMGRVVVKLEN